MASLILGAGMLTYNKIKESRAKKREKKQWRESSYAQLERETAERLAAQEKRRSDGGNVPQSSQSQSQSQGEMKPDGIARRGSSGSLKLDDLDEKGGAGRRHGS